MEQLLDVKDLHVSFRTYAGEVQAVRGVNFQVHKGEAIGIVGESGCGKSVTAQTILQLLPKDIVQYKQGSILFNGQDLLKKTEREMEALRGQKISMIFQDPMTSLNPTEKIGNQIAEGLIKHQKLKGKALRDRTIELLRLVGIPQPDKRVDQYPHEFSGGMRQRAMIAMALACNPELLIADEPTTALDVTIQSQILKLMKELKKKTNTSIILITHDLGVVADMCDRVIVMYAGQVVEQGTVQEIFYSPKHPYTQGLLKSIPRLDMDKNKPLFPILGTPPDLVAPPKGCSFFDRCEHAMKVCKEIPPKLESMDTPSQQSACWLYHPLAIETANEHGKRGI